MRQVQTDEAKEFCKQHKVSTSTCRRAQQGSSDACMSSSRCHPSCLHSFPFLSSPFSLPSSPSVVFHRDVRPCRLQRGRCVRDDSEGDLPTHLAQERDGRFDRRAHTAAAAVQGGHNRAHNGKSEPGRGAAGKKMLRMRKTEATETSRRVHAACAPCFLHSPRPLPARSCVPIQSKLFLTVSYIRSKGLLKQLLRTALETAIHVNHRTR